MIRSTFDSIKFGELSIRWPQTDRTCKDRVWDKRRTFRELNLIHKLKICMIMYILAAMFGSALSSTFDPTILIEVDPN